MKPEVKPLFQPIRIGGIELKNRIVMPPMDTCAFNFDGTVTPKLIDTSSDTALLASYC